MKRVKRPNKEIVNIRTRRTAGAARGTGGEHPVAAHYAVGGLAERIFAALGAAGVDVDDLDVDDLAPVDAFHIRGRAATRELLELAGIGAADRVLDVGCGIGGTTRFLAAATGCRVTGIDLTAEYVDVAELLATRVGLAGRVDFHRGDVLDLPFDDRTFDVAWTEHVQMNVADKAGFYAEIFRVLKPGGKLVFHDIFAGPEGAIHLPVPWAADAAISHLVPIEELRGLLAGAGFSQRSWEDKTGASVAFFADRRAARDKDAPAEEGVPPAEADEAALARDLPPAADLHVLIDDAATKLDNVYRNLREGRICVVQAVMKKPDDNPTGHQEREQ